MVASSIRCKILAPIGHDQVSIIGMAQKGLLNDDSVLFQKCAIVCVESVSKYICEEVWFLVYGAIERG